jgi:hypothetical protein
MVAVKQSPRALLSRNRLIALAVAIGVAVVCAYLAIFSQPLDAGSDEALNVASGQDRLTDAFPSEGKGPDGRAPLLVLDYIDGGQATLVKELHNSGPIPLTITGVETSPAQWLGLVTLKDPRSAVVVGRCCQLDEAATWSARDFRSIQVNPNEEGIIALHLLMSNCEDNGPGAYMIIDSIKVQYSVLGVPHDQAVEVGPYWFQSPNSCPRKGPARP